MLKWNSGFGGIVCLLSGSLAAAEPLGVECLRQAYPSFFSEYRAPKLFTHTGSFYLYELSQTADFESRLANASLADQLAQPYPEGFPLIVPLRDQDPGRLRFNRMFADLYGHSSAEVERNLVPVFWAPSGKKLMFSAVNGAAQALERVGRQITEQPELVAYVNRPLGSFNWRVIKGTERVSTHGFGIAIDFRLPTALTAYWLWSGCKPQQACVYPTQLQKDGRLQSVVELFEQQGFIWGGKWYHYDSIHFEYRPELVGPACKPARLNNAR